ncbi:hypothetical protein D9757_014867 [Collybiopsis confluens]|uniref:N-acetyltransferase domain-containing protein n=1 Tax=Collybiopsis confluens TaxID=2823264 RepID=A0A8H5CCP2_9AGAR|nr:hypothetical protein D9757_014867 [Collybiopsis confluens]
MLIYFVLSSETWIFGQKRLDHVLQYNIGFYLHYLSRWLDLCCVQEAPRGRMMGYVIGKAEGQAVEWHGHVTAITVAAEYRRLSLAWRMMNLLELVSNDIYRVCIDECESWCGKGGRDEEDAFGMSALAVCLLWRQETEKVSLDMRKPLSRDGARRSVRNNGRDIIAIAPQSSTDMLGELTETSSNLEAPDESRRGPGWTFRKPPSIPLSMYGILSQPMAGANESATLLHIYDNIRDGDTVGDLLRLFIQTLPCS